MTDRSEIDLSAGEWRARLAPGLGGAILDLTWREQPVFRPTPQDAGDILETACFPLVPYANRIAEGRFRFGGRDVSLPVLPRFAPHALHGDGWLNAWRVAAQDAHSATMSLDWNGEQGGWPWPWRAEQSVHLRDDGLQIDLSVANTGDRVMPAGLGLHPYFYRGADARLTLAATGIWLTDAREIPDRLAPTPSLIDWSKGADLADAPFVDHAYAGWDGVAAIEGDAGRFVMRASPNAGWAQVYAPQGESFFCVEPVTHRPDAVHALADEKTGLVELAPGQRLAMSMCVSQAA